MAQTERRYIRDRGSVLKHRQTDDDQRPMAIVTISVGTATPGQAPS